MALYKGRGVRLEVALNYAAAKAVSAVSLANPGVATSSAHALSAGAIGYMGDVTGMSQLDGQAIRVASPDSNTFQLEGVDTTNYPAFTGGNFYPVDTWATLSQAVDFQFGGGDAEKLDATTLLDFIKQEENGILAAETVTINMLADPKSQAVQRIRALALSSARSTWRITYPDSALEIYWHGEPSIPGFNQQKQQLATGSLQCTVKGYVLYL